MTKKMWLTGMGLIMVMAFSGCTGNTAGEKAADPASDEVSIDVPADENSMQAEAPKSSAEGIVDEDHSKDKIITEDEAVAIALKELGIVREAADMVRVKEDEEDGLPVYEVKILLESDESEFGIDKTTGTIIESDYDVDLDHRTTLPAGVISKEEAAAIILERVEGASREDLELELDKEEGHWIYEAELYNNGHEYEAELNGETGEIIKWKEELAD